MGQALLKVPSRDFHLYITGQNQVTQPPPEKLSVLWGRNLKMKSSYNNNPVCPIRSKLHKMIKAKTIPSTVKVPTYSAIGPSHYAQYSQLSVSAPSKWQLPQRPKTESCFSRLSYKISE